MTEKRGFTGQIHYDFDTSKNLEILLANETWHRVIPNEFRSFNGKRRITTYLKNIQFMLNIMVLFTCIEQIK